MSKTRLVTGLFASALSAALLLAAWTAAAQEWRVEYTDAYPPAFLLQEKARTLDPSFQPVIRWNTGLDDAPAVAPLLAPVAP
mgnify:CR=1 FL=1